MIVIIDNYDSFTYNLYQYLGEINPNIKVIRNDAVTIEELRKMNISHIIISPGPGFPKDAGISKEVIKEFAPKVPVLGVCLGHQSIGEVFGGKVVHAEKALHGKTSLIEHKGTDLFENVEAPLKVARYHSLIVERESLPEVLEVTAETEEGEIMAFKHRDYKVYGLQFHPESIYTDHGKQLLANFLNLS